MPTYTPMLDANGLNRIQLAINNGPRPFDIFEWGAGGSTIWFGKKALGRVVSVEHDETWYQAVSGHIVTEQVNVELLFRPPTIDITKHHSAVLPHRDFTSYAQAIHETNAYFDLIFVDGRARVLCFTEALKRVKPNGFVVIHDFERPRYQQCRTLARAQGFINALVQDKRLLYVCRKPPA